MDKTKESVCDFIDTFIGEGTNIKGDITFKEKVSISGTFEGNINSKKGSVIINESAEVKSEVKVAKAIIRGNFKGKIEATNKIEVFAPAKIEGDIAAPFVTMEEGTFFNGKCFMDESVRKKEFKELSISKIEHKKEEVLDKKKQKTLLNSLTNIFSKDI